MEFYAAAKNDEWLIQETSMDESHIENVEFETSLANIVKPHLY